MGAPLGSKNALGNKGNTTNHPSHAVIKVDARALEKMYFEKHDQEIIEGDIRKGKFSIHQRHILNAMEGDQKAINPIFQKLFPDTIKVEEETHLTIDV